LLTCYDRPRVDRTSVRGPVVGSAAHPRPGLGARAGCARGRGWIVGDDNVATVATVVTVVTE